MTLFNNRLGQQQTQSVKTSIFKDRASFMFEFNQLLGDDVARSLEWDHCVVSGFTVFRALSAQGDGRKTPAVIPITISFCQLDSSGILSRIKQFYNRLSSTCSLTINTTQTSVRLRSARCSDGRPELDINFSIVSYDSLYDMFLDRHDMDIEQFAFDGQRVWTTHRGMLAAQHHCNFASKQSYVLCGEDYYHLHLLECLDRDGVGLVYAPGDDKHGKQLVKHIESDQFYPSLHQTGVLKLVSLRENPELYRSYIDSIEVDLPIPIEEVDQSDEEDGVIERRNIDQIDRLLDRVDVYIAHYTQLTRAVQSIKWERINQHHKCAM
ncbi:hypothetical protein SAMD00019534_062460 [Acytostelium subglobosum LB1]|uniref:hypothetical protein n=1 Tax=Acytostelium subglobosum LB1 TaxID=1410327 RepID=UPI000644B553|nr:hypothetical protein SAMD00019534_062460 [Acytostelium subglobosum LB1]GAM23071.1 hypothetical protein SAMD00019534_062460 [Acytostelium subglobosum LB1]|eukprot:XP_012754298.1 hypothetical protein SAMD00019534_062460 [Acytostelium subglobosum LB1]